MKRNKCNATGKTMFKTRGEAKIAMDYIKGMNSTTGNNYTGKSSQKRAYFCEHCMSYHLTSTEAYKTKGFLEKDEFILRRKFFKDFDITNWKNDSIPFEDGHTPPPKNYKHTI